MFEGKAEGKTEGRTEGLRVAVMDLCEVLGISLTMAQLDLGGLESLRQHLKQHRAWPA